MVFYGILPIAFFLKIAYYILTETQKSSSKEGIDIMKKYELISYTSDLHYDIRNGFICSNVIIWARIIEKEVK